MQHPDVLIAGAAIGRGQDEGGCRGEGPHALVAESARELFADPASPVAGNPNGDVTVVEFFDYRCPYCKEVEPSLEALLSEDGKIRIVYKEFPILGTVRSPRRGSPSPPKQGKYDGFHAAMMATSGNITTSTVVSGGELGRARSRPAEEGHAGAGCRPDIIKANYEARAIRSTSDGTPAFVIGDEAGARARRYRALKDNDRRRAQGNSSLRAPRSG